MARRNFFRRMPLSSNSFRSTSFSDLLDARFFLKLSIVFGPSARFFFRRLLPVLSEINAIATQIPRKVSA